MDKKNAERKNSLCAYQETLTETAQKALALAKSQGASSAEVALSYDKGLSVTARLGEVETVEFNQDKTLGITVYIGQKRGSASSSDISELAIKQTVSHALDIAKVSDDDPCFGLADSRFNGAKLPRVGALPPLGNGCAPSN